MVKQLYQLNTTSVVFKPSEGTGQQSQENDSCSSEKRIVFFLVLKSYIYKMITLLSTKQKLCKLRSNLGKWKKMKGYILYVKLLFLCLIEELRKELCEAGCMFRWE